MRLYFARGYWHYFARVGGAAPCDVVFGRQPPRCHCLKQTRGVRATVAAVGPAAGGEVQPSRLLWRLRDIALRRLIEATSTARVSRALWTRATETGEGRFNVGDQVEIRRPPSAKDVS
eukprot:7134743-Pyramimonas_sp.AAC.1